MATSEQILSRFLELRKQSGQESIKFLMDHYGDTLYGITLKIVQETELADDALQEGFVKVWKNSMEFNPEKASLFTWLLTIIRNTAIDILRQEKRHKNQNLDPGVYNTINYSVESQIQDVGLVNQINKLESKYKELIELIYIKGFTQQEASDLLNIPLGTVKTRVNAAIKILRSLLSTFFLMLMNLFR